MGEQGYVVTFRQVDPLYTLDLRDPTAPKVVGELKIPGYSAYLHPVGEGRLLGIGREGADVQASLFDVSNPAAPQRLALHGVRPGRDAGRGRPARVPVLGEGQPRRDPAATPTARRPSFVGAEGLQIGAEHADVGRPHRAHDAPSAARSPIDRSFVIGDRLYTLSYLGLRLEQPRRTSARCSSRRFIRRRRP